MRDRKKQLAIWALLLTSLNTGKLFSEELLEETYLMAAAHHGHLTAEEGYTINFNNVSIVEYIRFVSKIFNVNFVFEEQDLQFTVTIVSEDPVSAKNVMSALVQVLRVHNLRILEQENNLLITKNPDVNQIPTIVSGDLPYSSGAGVPLVTRVFRIKNANLATLIRILRPMMSKSALIETSLETGQLIVTDITTNVEKIAQLLVSLDAPHSPLDFESYTAKYVALNHLIALTQQIITPFAESNPHIMVPQLDTNAIFIVSTPYLIDKTMAVLKDLDVPAEGAISHAAAENIFVYKPQNKDPSELQKALRQIADTLKEQKNPPLKLIESLTNAKVIVPSHSILFIGDNETMNKVREILASVDTSLSDLKETFLIYNIKNAQREQIEQALRQTADNLAHTEHPDKELITTIHSVKWIPETNSLVFTGDQRSLQKIRELLTLFDVAPGQASTASLPPTDFYVYTPQVRSGTEIIQSFQEIGNNLKETKFADSAFLQTLSTIRWVPSTNSLIFTGSPKSLNEVKALLSTIDSGEVKSKGEVGFYLYKLQHLQGDVILGELKKMEEGFVLSNLSHGSDISYSIRTIKWIKDSNSLLITGSTEAVNYIKDIIAQLDCVSKEDCVIPRGTTTFIIYKPQYQSGPDLITILQDFGKNLTQSGVEDPGLFDALSHLKWIERTSSLLISGDSTAIAKVQELLQKFDIAGTSIGNTTIGTLENTNFLVYKLQYHKGEEITSALKQIATDLSAGGPASNQGLLNAVNSLQWINVTNSLIASGNQETLTKLRSLIENLDVPLRQVFIEVLIIQTNLANTQNFGLQWGGKSQYLERFALGGSNMPFSQGQINNFMPGLGAVNGSVTPDAALMIPPGSPVGTPSLLRGIPVPGFDLGVIGDIILHKGRSFLSLGSLLTAIQIDSDSTVVMNPKIITQDNNNSTIFVGQNIPFTSAVVQNQISGTSGSLSTVNIEYRDVGVNLSITPILGNNDVVTLQIINDITQQVPNTLNLTTTGNSSITGLQTSHTNMSTRVTVPDKHFLALSGMIQDTNNHYKTSIPCLGGLPLIGAAFGNNNRDRNKNNIIIFVRPQIINSFADYSKITDHQENLYEESAFLPAVQESFEAAIDLVKTPEDEYK